MQTFDRIDNALLIIRLYICSLTKPMSAREQSYFTAIQNSDEHAFEALFLRHYASLVSFSAAFIPAIKDEAKDIVAEVFGHLWINRCQITLRGSLTAYLYTAVRNRTIDHLRKQKIKPVVFKEEVEEILLSTELPDKQLLYKETSQRIAVLVEQLPAQAKMIFKMNRDEGLSYEEIATVLQLSINSVKTQMYRSLRFLKEQYATSCG